MKALPAEQLLDSLSVRLNGPKAGARRMALNLSFTDTGETYLLKLENAVLHHQRGRNDAKANASIALTRTAFAEIVLREKTLADLVAAKAAKVEGEAAVLDDVVQLLDVFDFWFEIVMP